MTNSNGSIKVKLDMKAEEFLTLLRGELPKLLKEDADFRAQIIGMLAESLGTKGEFLTLLEEIRALRTSSDRRFEAIDRRFEAMDRRFEAIDRRFEAIERTLDEHTQQLRELRVGMGSLGGRMGRGLEEVIRQVIQDFSGVGELTAERLVLEDETGEVFGVAGARLEFDAYVRDGRRFLVEVKNYLKEGDVLAFHRKAAFAEKRLGMPVEKVLFAPAVERKALETAEGLGILIRTFSVVD